MATSSEAESDQDKNICEIEADSGQDKNICEIEAESDICEICEEDKAVFWCQNCTKKICKGCKRIPKCKRENLYHSSILITDITEVEIQMAHVFDDHCKHHTKEKVKWYVSRFISIYNVSWFI